MKTRLKTIWGNIKKNQRYVWVFLVLILVFLINRGLPTEVITSESCAGGNCPIILENPSLTDENPRYYANDVFKSQKGEFYRIIFEVRASQKTAFSVFATNPFDEDKELKDITIDKQNAATVEEVYLASDNDYTDLLFKKDNPTDGASLIISQVHLSRLNITSEKEITSLSPTIVGGANFRVTDQEQSQKDYSFEQLKEPKVFFGQIFQPQLSYLTGVTLDIDIVKQNKGEGEYAIEVRNVDGGSDIPEIKSGPLASIKFSMDDLEKYRQEDGLFFFPLIAKLDTQKKYFVGIDNSDAEVNASNYLILRGSQNENSYLKGTAAVKYKKYSYLAQGNLYFQTSGFEPKKYQDVSILPGSVIEDRGNGKVFFSYQQQKSPYETINFYGSSDDIFFDTENGALYGRINEKSDSYMIYKFNTVYPFKDFSFSVDQVDITWNKLKVSYSFDKENWQEIPEKMENGLQTFNYSQSPVIGKHNEIYFKIESSKDKYPAENKFGINNLKFQAELTTK